LDDGIFVGNISAQGKSNMFLNIPFAEPP
jgi:hypothetical protein